jgi:hypothetical protein
VYGWMDAWVDGWMGVWLDGWMGGWVDGWIGGWVDRWIGGCFWVQDQCPTTSSPPTPEEPVASPEEWFRTFTGNRMARWIGRRTRVGGWWGPLANPDSASDSAAHAPGRAIPTKPPTVIPEPLFARGGSKAVNIDCEACIGVIWTRLHLYISTICIYTKPLLGYRYIA